MCQCNSLVSKHEDRHVASTVTTTYNISLVANGNYLGKVVYSSKLSNNLQMYRSVSMGAHVSWLFLCQQEVSLNRLENIWTSSFDEQNPMSPNRM